MESALRGLGHFGNDQNEALVIGKCISLEIYGHFGYLALTFLGCIAPENRPLEKEIPIGTTILRGHVSCRECTPLHHAGCHPGPAQHHRGLGETAGGRWCTDRGAIAANQCISWALTILPTKKK